MLTIRELRSDDEISRAFPLMSALRDRIRADTFLSEVRRQHADGYRLFGAYDRELLVALAGVGAPTPSRAGSTSSSTTSSPPSRRAERATAAS